MKSWVIYLLLCKDKSLYCGITNNLEKRIATHNKGKGAKYTKTRLPVSLYSSFSIADKPTALRLEYQIKKLSRKEKLALDETIVQSILDSLQVLSSTSTSDSD